MIAEGSGITTEECYDKLGYRQLEDICVELIDLNNTKKCETMVVSDETAIVLKEFHIPKIMTHCYLVSLVNCEETLG